MKPSNNVAEVKISYSPKCKAIIKINSAKDAENIFRDIWEEGFSHIEYFYLLLLNRANKVLGYHLLSKGGTASTVVDLKVLLQVILKRNASSIIVAHNHPSGNLKPSQQDKKLTQKIKSACKLMDINFLDHLIMTEDDYYSFADELEL